MWMANGRREMGDGRWRWENEEAEVGRVEEEGGEIDVD